MKASKFLFAPPLAIGMAAGTTGMTLKWENGRHVEVVSSNPFCTACVNRHGEPQHYSDERTPDQKRESYEYAQRNR